jgi:hypothetical protein
MSSPVEEDRQLIAELGLFRTYIDIYGPMLEPDPILKCHGEAMSLARRKR